MKELTTIKEVTIIASGYLKDNILDVMKGAGISGYTYSMVKGQSASGIRSGRSEEVENVEIKTLAEPIIATSLMDVISEKFFNEEKIAVYEQDARVIRAHKYGRLDQDWDDDSTESNP